MAWRAVWQQYPNLPRQAHESGKGMKKFTDFLGDVMLMLCAIAGIGMVVMVFVYLAMELSK